MKILFLSLMILSKSLFAADGGGADGGGGATDKEVRFVYNPNRINLETCSSEIKKQLAKVLGFLKEGRTRSADFAKKAETIYSPLFTARGSLTTRFVFAKLKGKVILVEIIEDHKYNGSSIHNPSLIKKELEVLQRMIVS